jgi:hypothetical protein
MPKLITLRNGAVAAALMAGVFLLAAPAVAQDYPNRIVMWVFSPTASTALTLALGPV